MVDSTSLTAVGMPSDDFLTYGKDCPLCYQRFDHIRPRESAFRLQKKDSDFHLWYEGPNPNHYVVVVCSHCWYASFVGDFNELKPYQRDQLAKIPNLREVMAAKGYHFDFGKPRSPQAVEFSFKLALQWYEWRKVGPARLAEVWLHLAWLQREQSNLAGEIEMLDRARNLLITAYEKSELEEDAERRAAYLIFDLSLRLEKLDDASVWSSVLMGDSYLANHRGLRTMFLDRLNDYHQMRRVQPAAAA